MGGKFNSVKWRCYESVPAPFNWPSTSPHLASPRTSKEKKRKKRIYDEIKKPRKSYMDVEKFFILVRVVRWGEGGGFCTKTL